MFRSFVIFAALTFASATSFAATIEKVKESRY